MRYSERELSLRRKRTTKYNRLVHAYIPPQIDAVMCWKLEQIQWNNAM